MEYHENIILYDYLSFTCKWQDPQRMTEFLGMDHLPWQTVKGAHGYRDRLYFNKISIHYNGRPDMGIWCEMTGQGCRAFETLSKIPDWPDKWAILLPLIVEEKMRITRLDVAYDDHTGMLDLGTISADTCAQEYVSKSDYWETVNSSRGQTVYIGAPQSEVQIRIYDKARERNCAPGTHWIRCELQLRRDRALAFVELPYSIGESFCGVMVNYLRYVEPMPGDSNKWRWPIKDYWGEFLCHANAIKIYRSPGLEYNMDRLENYLFRQAGNAIDAYIKAKGLSVFLEKLENRPVRRNPKYDAIVEEYKAFGL